MSKSLVVWSGGFDSTAVLLWLISNGVTDFDTCYINFPNNEKMQLNEKAAREKIKALMSPFVKFNDHDFSYVCSIAPPQETKLHQPYVWLTTLCFCIPEGYDRVYFGYITGDCFWHIRERFVSIFESLYLLLRPEQKKEKVPELVFPFEWQTKDSIREQFYGDRFADILPMIWTCDSPTEDDKPCEKCSKCKEYKLVTEKKIICQNIKKQE